MARVVLCFFLTAVLASAAERSLEARGLHLSSYDDQGRLLRKLSSALASGPVTRPTVKEGKVEFFGPDSARLPEAALEWREATYLRPDDVILGDGTVRFSSEKGMLSGQGFHCDLKSGHLQLKADIRAKVRGIRIEGDRAEVYFDPQGKKTMAERIRQADISGNVVIHPDKMPGFDFEKAECALVRYDAAENKLRLKTPVTLWKEGAHWVIDTRESEFLDYNLGQTER